MRDGPPAMASSSSSFSTSTLLKEISCLRAQLKELEDDNKSTVSSAVLTENMVNGGESESMLLLRKELATVINEKANLEKEFMNQLSTLAQDNRAIVSDLQNKLVRAEARNASLQKQISANGKDDGDTRRWMKILEEERDRHNEEVERMKTTLHSSDKEVAESRREIDHMAEKLEAMLAEKDELLREVTDVRLQFSEEQRRTEGLRAELKECNSTIDKLRQEMAEKDDLVLEKTSAVATKEQELGEMNDTLIELESHKEMLLSEVGDLKNQLEKVKKAKNKSKNFSEEAISPSEKEALTNGVQMLEERLEKFQSKLSERDHTIEMLSSNLTEERRCNEKLKAQIKKISGANVDSLGKLGTERWPPVSPKEQVSSLSVVTSPNKVSSEPSPLCTPRTPVASIVASFERRHSRDFHSQELTSTPRDSHEGTEVVLEAEQANRVTMSVQVSTLQKKLEESNAEIERLQSQLMQAEKLNQSALDDLREQLTHERGLVAKLRSDLENALLRQGTVDRVQSEVKRLKSQLQECDALQVRQEQSIMQLEQELLVEKEKSHDLHIKLDESDEQYSKSLTEMATQLYKEQEKVQLLMLKAENQDMEHAKEIKDIEERLSRERTLVSKLRTELDSSSQPRISPSNFEVQLQESKREIERLRSQLSNLDVSKESSDLPILRMAARQGNVDSAVQEEKKEISKSDHDEEVSRLRSQVQSLQEELGAAMGEIERLLEEIESLRNILRKDDNGSKLSEEVVLPIKTQRSYEAQLTKLQVELTKTQVAKQEVQTELTKKISVLEEELGALESQAEEELEAKEKEIQGLREDLAAKEARVAQLEEQQNQICSSINDVSHSRQGDMEELQAELISMTSKTSAQAREIQCLKMKIDELEARKSDCEQKLLSRINELEEEIVDITRKAQSHDSEPLREENSKLRDAVRDLRLERRQLQDRLDSLASDKSNSKSAQVLRERNIVLKDEVEKLTKRLKKMEASITRFAI